MFALFRNIKTNPQKGNNIGNTKIHQTHKIYFVVHFNVLVLYPTNLSWICKKTIEHVAVMIPRDLVGSNQARRGVQGCKNLFSFKCFCHRFDVLLIFCWGVLLWSFDNVVDIDCGVDFALYFSAKWQFPFCLRPGHFFDFFTGQRSAFSAIEFICFGYSGMF